MNAGEWVAHDGKGMPVAGDVMVLCRFNDGCDEELEGLPPSPAEYWDDLAPNCNNWLTGGGSAIAEYKVVA